MSDNRRGFLIVFAIFLAVGLVELHSLELAYTYVFPTSVIRTEMPARTVYRIVSWVHEVGNKIIAARVIGDDEYELDIALETNILLHLRLNIEQGGLNTVGSFLKGYDQYLSDERVFNSPTENILMAYYYEKVAPMIQRIRELEALE